MKIPKNRIIHVTLRAADGSDIVTNQPVRFSGEAYHFLTLQGLGFKKIWASSTTAVYSQVTYSDLSSIAAVDCYE
ncbi:hypothetical protein [Microcoleus sp.]|uniref:hypothetical protein n=1 Tax=Microcoleus sp. TaxID=44472 RepID=UPI0035949378